MPDVQSEFSEWIPIAGGVLTAVAGAIGLPKIIADRKAKKAKQAEALSPAAMLPSRIPMVDRVPEVAEVLRLLDAGESVVTVEGARGVGKSALVVEAAHQLAAGNLTGRGRRAPAAVLFWLDAGNDCPDLTDLARKLSLYSGEQALTTAPSALKADAL